ncbi:MAG: sugar ABC transporter ATP-binding protein [Lachnospiraceae bacterium]|nr:sugar ABC transporter ATP-binding protein [Lachnospiraceae bacterium]MBQ9563222.1 sugar ABC transporter ATP-binding protein [Lachnospiraceae bacterium]MBQ9592316.1 sugar ABC transporter ATP-binding protein [Lachnospiraceae bacterium]MBR0152857.1 sugar ABC transporter ATP-binding protein [Lachnospiraceae bacterium]
MSDIDKRFGGVHALDHVTFEVLKGEVHVLMGENGAGKSTLMKILDGLYTADSGKVFIDGEEVHITSPLQARDLGVAMIHQELSMCENMTIAENIFRGEEMGKYGMVDFKKMYADAQKILDDMNLKLNAHTIVKTLSIAQKQMVEIAGAVSHNAKIVIMDEPTSSLTEVEIKELFKIVRDLKAKDTGIIYISHRMNETFVIGDRVTVMRDGQYIDTLNVAETNEDAIIELMVGRAITEVYEGERAEGGEVVLKVEHFTNEKLKDCSFELRKGEILGFSGLVGAGRTELMRAVFALDKVEPGAKMTLFGKEVHFKRVQDAIDAGIGMVPEDRRGAGLVLGHSVATNLTIAVLKKFIKGIRVDKKKEREIVEEYRHKLSIKTTGPDQVCGDLSGGNQQKVVISKWLAAEPKILIMDEPTRGIDVGAKHEIYQLMRRLASEGVSIIFISSDLPEIINMSSRVVVMHEGHIAKVLDGAEEEFTQTKIMRYATGQGQES